MKKGDRISTPRSVEHRNKLSLAMRGNTNHLGYTHTKETREKIALKMMFNKHTLGKSYGRETKLKDSLAKLGAKNPAWCGGISFEPYSAMFNIYLKEEILKRDNFKCVICGKDNKLHIHHIDYDKKNCNKENLVVLCHSCHSKTNHHRKNWGIQNGQFQRISDNA